MVLGCFRRFQLRARLGSPWHHRLSPLADPTVQIYRRGSRIAANFGVRLESEPNDLQFMGERWSAG